MVTETAGVNGGHPCVSGTRIPVRSLVLASRAGADVYEIFPTLQPEQIDAALRWYAAYPQRVDKDIARNEDALAGVAQRNLRCRGVITASVQQGRVASIASPDRCYRITKHDTGYCWQHRDQVDPRQPVPRARR